MRKSLIFTVLISLLFSCSEEDLKKEEYELRLQSLYQEIENLVAEGNCATSNDCKVMPLGDKACGGPSGYIILSTEVDSEKLEDLVNEYTHLEQEYNQKFGIPSDCSLVNPPENIGCISSECARIMN